MQPGPRWQGRGGAPLRTGARCCSSPWPLVASMQDWSIARPFPMSKRAKRCRQQRASPLASTKELIQLRLGLHLSSGKLSPARPPDVLPSA